MKNLIVVKAGENVFLDAEVFGKPLPKVSWKRDGVPLGLAEGMKMVQKKHVHLLELYSVTRKESGDYAILAENINGSKYATIKVKVLGEFGSSNGGTMHGGQCCPVLPPHHAPTLLPADKPGPPASVKTTKVFSDRVKLRWEPPLADGGSEITNYIIEKRETSRANWALVTSNIHGHITDCSVEKLIEGHEYQFRVSAENQYGVGDPVMTEPVTVKNPYGEAGWAVVASLPPPQQEKGSHKPDLTPCRCSGPL